MVGHIQNSNDWNRPNSTPLKSYKLCNHTAKKEIGNRLSRLKSAPLFIKNTISSRGIFLSTHSVRLYIKGSKKIFPTMLMGENPWYLMENSTPHLCWEMPTIYRKIWMPG
jgi:hypothetical protein